MYNYLIDADITEVGYTEPVSVTEAKEYIRVTHSSEDTLIGILITGARQTIENATGLSLLEKTIDIWFSNEGGGFQIPFGPVQGDITFTDSEGVDVDATLTGSKHPILTDPLWKNLKASYTAGYDVVPKALKVAILDQVNFMYENRGANDDKGICPKAWRTCQQYTKQSPII